MASRAGNPGVILEWLTLFILIALPVLVGLALALVPEPIQKVIPRQKPTLRASMTVISAQWAIYSPDRLLHRQRDWFCHDRRAVLLFRQARYPGR